MKPVKHKSSQQRREYTELERKRFLGRAYRPPSRPRKRERSRGGGGTRAREWTQAELQLLGKITDEEAAQRIGRTVRAVALKRWLLGVPSIVPGSRPWTRKELNWLGRLSDADVAARTGRPLYGVILKRRKLGRPSPNPKSRPALNQPTVSAPCPRGATFLGFDSTILPCNITTAPSSNML